MPSNLAHIRLLICIKYGDFTRISVVTLKSILQAIQRLNQNPLFGHKIVYGQFSWFQTAIAAFGEIKCITFNLPHNFSIVKWNYTKMHAIACTLLLRDKNAQNSSLDFENL